MLNGKNIFRINGKNKHVFRIGLLATCLIISVTTAYRFWPKRWSVFSQSGVVHYSATVYASYQFNVLKHPTGLVALETREGTREQDPLPSQLILFIADSGNHVIRRFTGGTLDVVAGSVGVGGYVDGSPENARFASPTGLSGVDIPQMAFSPDPETGLRSFDHWENFQVLYINDAENYVIRKLCTGNIIRVNSLCSTAGGSVATVCGSHNKGLVDGSNGSACFAALGGIAGSVGRYYVADSENHCIRMWDGSNVSTVAGTGSYGYVDGYKTSAQFMVPTKTTEDSSGNIYVADAGNNAIRKIDTSGNVTTCAGGGPMQIGLVDGQGTSARFTRPTSVVFNPADNMLYIADSHNNCIRRIDPSGNVTTYAGTHEPGLVNGSLSQARFSMPMDLVILNGVMYISDTMNNVIRRIDMNAGVVSTYIQ
jgi:hypothetical protein